MKQFVYRFALTALLVAAASLFCFGQGGGVTASISGVVVDQSGGVIPGAEVTVKNDATSAEAMTITADNGTFSIPALSSGTYTATVMLAGFKQAIVKDIKLLAGVPASIRVSLQVGDINETILVEAGADIVQTQTANVTTTLTTNQIANLPLNSRNALNFVINLPGVNTPGSERNSTIMGLPQSMINITIDGVSSQDNYNRTSDGFFSRIRPSLDAVEEVTVSTATPGAESAGSGAVQIKFITRSGNNEYHGSLYEYLRNTSLNANTWFNNRDLLAPAGTDPSTWKAPRTIVKLNQFGGRVGGPIRFPKLFDGRDKAFFFVNMEESRSPSSITRNRTIFTPEAEQGNFLYTVSGQTRSVNLLTLAASKGQTSTFDPTIQKLLADIRNSTSTGSLNVQTNPLYETLTFVNPSMSKTRFTTTRFDINLTSRHRVEVSWNYHQYIANKYDLTNSRDPAYPGFPNWGVQGGNRYHGSIALRSSLKPTLVNELRTGMSGGGTLFSPNITAADFSGSVANMDGFALNINRSGLYNAYRHYTPSRRNPVSKTIEDTLTWTRGSHNFSFGFSWTEVNLYIQNQTMVPFIDFGTNTTYDPARILFDSTNGPTNFPGSSSTQRTAAANMYAVLTGRVTSITGTAYLNELTNEYAYNGDRFQRGHMRELGLFFTDSWRVRRGLTLNYGLRWGFQYPFVPGNDVYTTGTIEDIWGISGVGNLFKPGVLTGKEPEFVQFKKGTPANNLSYKDFAPSFGFAWSPSVKDGWLGKIVGEGGQSVVRGGYSLAYSRYGMATYANTFNGNPGAFVNATRNVTNGNLVNAGETWPLLFRDKSRLGSPAFQKTPVYPMKGTISDSITIFDPDLRTPYAQSWTFGIQRELTKNMVLEVRYVGTRSLQGWTEYNLNELNIVENGFFNEFKLAMTNLQANVAAGRSADGFKYRGPGTGTHPLPIILAYFSGVPASLAGDSARYTSTNFTSSTYVNQLAQRNPGPSSFASSLHGDPTRRANALTAGLPINFFLVNPHLMGGANIAGSGAFTRYDSMVVEVRRRMAQGLLVQANYVWAKAFDSSRYSYRMPRVSTYSDTLPHAFKVNWVYELPFGRGRTFLASSGGVIDHILGGWDFNGVGRIQSGRLEDFGNLQMVGMTHQELKEVYGLRFDDANRIVYNLPDDIIQNTIKAFNTDPTSATGYSALGVPEGRYFAPANSMGCIQVVTGDCAPHNLFVRGNTYWNFDLSVMKRFRFTEQLNFELRGEFLNAFNNVVFTNASNAGSSQTWGQVTGTVNSPRVVQIVMRLNF